MPADLTEISFRPSLLPVGGIPVAGDKSVLSSVQEVRTVYETRAISPIPLRSRPFFLPVHYTGRFFLEGPAGSGKTQLAYAVAQAANTSVERLQCYEGIGEDKAIGKFDESLQRLCVELKAKASGVDWEIARERIAWASSSSARDRFFVRTAIERPCVLLIDELDKVDHAFEAMLSRSS